MMVSTLRQKTKKFQEDERRGLILSALEKEFILLIKKGLRKLKYDLKDLGICHKLKQIIPQKLSRSFLLCVLYTEFSII